MRAAIARVAVVCLLVVTASLAAAPVSSLESGASSTYDLDVVGSISTPEETIEIEGDRYTIDGIGVVEPGDPIEIDVASEKDYQLFLYNSEMQDEYHDTWSADEERVAMGTADDPLDTSDLEPGTYMLSLSPKGEGRQAIHPLVVQAFDLRLDYPRSAAQGETIELGATIDSSDASAVTGVEIALWDETTDSVTEVPLEAEGDGSYSATLELDGDAEGEYGIYGAALGDEEIDGRPVPIAVANGATMTVSADDGDDEPDDGEDDGDDESDDAETTDNESETVDDSITDAEDNETESNGGADGDDDGDTADVIEPSGESDNETVDDDGDDALGTPGAVLVALVLFLGTVAVSEKRRSSGR